MVTPSAYGCRPSRGARGHTFSHESGWCDHGCGVRSDGLVISARTGDVIAQPSQRATEASHAVEQAENLPEAAPGGNETHTRSHSDFIDITEPRRSNERDQTP